MECLSYHADADINTNPFELGFDRLVSLDSDINFIGKEALKKIKQDGITRKQVGIEIDCDPLSGPNTLFGQLKKIRNIGKVTSAVYSPRLKKNIALAMIEIEQSEIGNELKSNTNEGIFNCKIVEKPFYDPKKKLYQVNF